MAARKLAANVYVNGTLYEAGTSPGKEVADQIPNPKAWASEEAATPAQDNAVGDSDPKALNKAVKKAAAAAEK